MKRAIDIVGASLGLALSAPVLVVLMIAIWVEDRGSPFYIAPRAGLRERPFGMVKLRSMRAERGSGGPSSTADDDPRITATGRVARRAKLDELPQLWNVLRGDMSLVGPRPQTLPDVARYTAFEREMLNVRPGITDIASIVFADEGEILRGSQNADAQYDHVIRPWKSRLAILYVKHGFDAWLDLRLLLLTARNAFSRRRTLESIGRLVRELGGDASLQRVASRSTPLGELHSYASSL